VKEKISTERIEWVDIAKGILIVLVVMGHVKSSYSSSGLLQDSIVLNYSNAFAYSFHMAAFFFLSGLLFSRKHSKKSLSARIIDKLIAYGIPYIIFSVVYWVMQILMASSSNHSIAMTDILKIFLFPFSYLWFVYALMLMQVIQELLADRKATAFGIAIVLFAVNCVLETQLDGTVYSDLIICDFMSNYIYFAAGVFLGEKLVAAIGAIRHKKIASIAFSMVLVVGAACKLYFPIGYVGMLFLAGLGTCTVIVVSQTITSNKIIEYLGRMSMPIYLLHGYVISFTRIVLTKLHVPVGGGYTAIAVYCPWSKHSINCYQDCGCFAVH